MERVILHSDINACYANVERLYDPSLCRGPMAVCGDVEARHGIVLSKDELAKRAGVKTGMAIWQARQVCPELQVVAPHFDRYLKYSRMIQEIYCQYTDLCEPFGIDESWLDITGCLLHPDGKEAALEIKRRVYRETGLTVSIGVSWNKVLAKLGSDYKKPDAVTVIDRAHFHAMVWPLPASDLLMVGRSTARTLARLGIGTIGELAQADPDLLRQRLGKMGLLIHAYANGQDRSPVRRTGDEPPPKSIGNSTTTPRDLVCDRDVWLTFLTLAESVGARLREQGFRCRTVEISLRTPELAWSSHRTRLFRPTDCTRDLLECAMQLFRECHEWPGPLRSVGLRAAELVRTDAPEQLDLFTDYARLSRRQGLDQALDKIRGKYGYESIRYAAAMHDEQLGALNAREEHTIHPVGFAHAD
ncbi:MAG: DNA polymerase IV [Oscillospiraceae bacterium]|nr:DNA polymerase IV [Oscillospiraceae bacterium]